MLTFLSTATGRRSTTVLALTALVATMLTGLLTPPTYAQSVIYVDTSASGANDGSSWADAYTDLQDALTAAASGDEIWVAAGIYYPDEGTGLTDNDRTLSFELQTGVALYGGFAGTETTRNQRDWATNVTTMSGDLQQNDGPDFANTADNSINVVFSDSVDATAVLDGFTVTGGNADGGTDFCPESCGGGLYNDNASSPTLTNLIIVGNQATAGGGMFNFSSSPSLINVTISGNLVDEDGGGVLNLENSATLTDVIISGNQAGNDGGGMINIDSSPNLTDVTISGNQAGDDGAGLYNFESNPTLADVTISNNQADDSGGGLYNYTSSPTLTDVTISDNQAADDGGGLRNFEGSSPTLTNVTVRDNSADDQGGGIYNSDGSTLTMTGGTISDNRAGTGSPASLTEQRGGGIFSGDDTGPLTLTDVMITNNTSEGRGGGIYSRASRLTITDSTIDDNTANDATYGEGGGIYIGFGSEPHSISGGSISGNTANGAGEALVLGSGGGGIYLNADETLTITGTQIFSNTVTADGADGGGIYATGSALVLDNANVSDNTADDRGGGVYVGAISDPCVVSPPTTLTVRNGTTITGNLTAEDGGGIYAGDCDVVTVTDSTISGNLTTDSFDFPDGSGGGGIHANGADVTIARSTLSDNITGGQGGGVFFSNTSGIADSNLTISDSTIGGTTLNAGNIANYGGGIYVADSAPAVTTVTETTIGFNVATGNGGGIAVGTESSITDTLIISTTDIISNTADGAGGGIYNNGRTVTATNSIFSGNQANEGGGIYSFRGDPTLINVLLSGNLAEDGGGLYNGESDTAMTNVTFSGNQASEGGGIYSRSSSPTLQNSIIWGNDAPTGPEVANDGSMPAYTNSLVQNEDLTGTGTGNLDGTDASNDPRFVAPEAASNAPTTAGDYRLRFDSSALDAGDSSLVPSGVTSDLAGNPRVVGNAVDLGAYEHPQQTPVITWGDPSAIAFGTALDATQLNATADVAGSFVYTPTAGTILDVGNGQTLATNFIPDDAGTYIPVTATVQIDVQTGPVIGPVYLPLIRSIP